MPRFATDTVILITGATGGIGREIARQAAAAGAIVGVHGSREGSVAEAIASLRADDPDGRFIPLPGDFREAGAIGATVAACAAAGGRLDAVIHCAITGAPGAQGLFAETDPGSFGMHAHHVMGIFQTLCAAALPHLKARGGTIIGFASDAGRYPAARQTIIGSAFGGLISFVRNLAVEIARDGVRVHCLSPSFVADTLVFARAAGAGPRAEKARARAGLGLPTPRDIAPLALFLCSDDAARITGQVISINGGMNA